MSLQTIGKNGRVYQRKFDHDEARERHAAGETIAALAQEYGVTKHAVWFVASERGREYRRERKEWIKTAARCVRCGAPTNLLAVYISGSRFCRSCAHDNQATSVGDGELRCHDCGKWKPDEDFPHNRAARIRRRGRHTHCRVCATRQRQEYREKNKVPCIGCGKLVLRPSEKGPKGSPWPRCYSCANRGIVPAESAA